jgi:hypothetical protein
MTDSIAKMIYCSWSAIWQLCASASILTLLESDKCLSVVFLSTYFSIYVFYADNQKIVEIKLLLDVYLVYRCFTAFQCCIRVPGEITEHKLL